MVFQNIWFKIDNINGKRNPCFPFRDPQSRLGTGTRILSNSPTGTGTKMGDQGRGMGSPSDTCPNPMPMCVNTTTPPLSHTHPSIIFIYVHVSQRYSGFVYTGYSVCNHSTYFVVLRWKIKTIVVNPKNLGLFSLFLWKEVADSFQFWFVERFKNT